MKILLLSMILIPTASFSENVLINSNKLFDFAGRAYPEFFSPAGVATTARDEYLTRYYSDTGNYIGTSGEEVYVYGKGFNGLLKAGVISDSIELEANGDTLLTQLFANGQSNVQGYGTGVVIAILPDDRDGNRHQKFIIELKSKQTLLIAHNIDLSSRIDALSLNDSIEFLGAYEWNDQGVIIYWTHHDPEAIHANGWIFHNNIICQ